MKIYNEEEVRLIANAAATAWATRDHPAAKSVDETITDNLKIAGLDDFGMWEIARERADQLWRHGRTVERDVEINNAYELSFVAGLLISYDYYTGGKNMTEDEYLNAFCPVDWDKEVLRHMLQKPYVERMRTAGALLAAEISRCRVANDTGSPALHMHHTETVDAPAGDDNDE